MISEGPHRAFLFLLFYTHYMMRLLTCILLFLFIGCGKQHFPDYSEHPVQQEEQAPGYYTGRFKVLNSKYSGPLNAHALVWLKGQQFYARVVMMRGASASIYQQFIHKGGTCPTSKNDLNRDGVISLDEVVASSGPMLIPLDRNLKTQDLGLQWFPRADYDGVYYYSRSADIGEMMIDLRKRDTAPGRGLAKLDPGEEMDMGRRTIVLYRSSPEAFLPVGCAELRESVEQD